MAVGSKKAEENMKLLTEKKKIFSKLSIFPRGVADGFRGSHVALGDLRLTWVALGDHGWP
jgi:hypothetical protein